VGPAPGKTVVALHRAAYLLYTFRFPLEDQGVLVIGPNRLFLRYISQVLPSLGEAGVEQMVLTEMVPGVRFGGVDTPTAARVKGQARMVPVIAKAVRDRERPLKQDVKVPFGTTYLTLRAAESERIVAAARRRFRRHNAARRFVENEVFEALTASAREEVAVEIVRDRTRHTDEVRVALERMWPLLTPAQLLHDLYGSKALLRLAGGHRLSDAEVDALFRARSEELAEVHWTEADAPLLDEALALLGPKPGKGGKILEEDEIRTYGHIVIDEVQDLSAMQLRMASRRSLSGSMTVVGDIAQATGWDAPDSWDEVLAHLPDRRPARVVELSVGYRIPGLVMDRAAKVLAAAAPGLRPPRSVRHGEHPPSDHPAAGRGIAAALVESLQEAEIRVGDGGIAVITPGSMVEQVSAVLHAAGITHGVAPGSGMDQRITVVPVGLVKGLEMDAAVVIEPSLIVEEQPQGLRALYVALTRATKHLGLVYELPLPASLVDA
jgi:DNA helicase IV